MATSPRQLSLALPEPGDGPKGATRGRPDDSTPVGRARGTAARPLAVTPEDPDVRAFEARLRALVRQPLALVVTDNRRTMISSRRRDGRVEVRLHHMFLGADDATVRALGRYLVGRDARASAHVSAFIERHGGLIRRGARRAVPLRTAGRVHDLGALYAELNRDHFEGGVDVRVTWGRRGAPGRGRRRRGSIRLGTYTPEDRLVRIHPTLDQAWVPRFFVAFILFHEMLHHVIPAVVRDGRHAFHPPAFRARERAYPDYDRAIRWEKANLHRLLAAR